MPSQATVKQTMKPEQIPQRSSPAKPSSVHPLRITVDPEQDLAFLHEETQPQLSPATLLIHGHQLTKFKQTCNALWSIPGLRTQYNRLQSCGRDSWIEKNYETGEVRIRIANCGLRCCPRCQRQHADRIYDTIHDTLRRTKGTTWRFVTFTLKSSTFPLRSQLQFLRESFRRLRQSKTWQRCCEAGVAIIECTFNKETNQWHPHLHVIVGGTYIPQAQLSKAWMKATGNSPVVDVRKIADKHRAAQYLSQYVTKPPGDEVYENEERLREWILALKGARFLIRFGNIQFVRDKREKAPTEPVWTRLQSLEKTLQLAAEGDAEAIELLKAVNRGPPNAHCNDVGDRVEDESS